MASSPFTNRQLGQPTVPGLATTAGSSSDDSGVSSTTLIIVVCSLVGVFIFSLVFLLLWLNLREFHKWTGQSSSHRRTRVQGLDQGGPSGGYYKQGHRHGQRNVNAFLPSQDVQRSQLPSSALRPPSSGGGPLRKLSARFMRRQHMYKQMSEESDVSRHSSNPDIFVGQPSADLEGPTVGAAKLKRSSIDGQVLVVPEVLKQRSMPDPVQQTADRLAQVMSQTSTEAGKPDNSQKAPNRQKFKRGLSEEEYASTKELMALLTDLRKQSRTFLPHDYEDIQEDTEKTQSPRTSSNASQDGQQQVASSNSTASAAAANQQRMEQRANSQDVSQGQNLQPAHHPPVNRANKPREKNSIKLGDSQEYINTVEESTAAVVVQTEQSIAGSTTQGQLPEYINTAASSKESPKLPDVSSLDSSKVDHQSVTKQELIADSTAHGQLSEYINTAASSKESPKIPNVSSHDSSKVDHQSAMKQVPDLQQNCRQAGREGEAAYHHLHLAVSQPKIPQPIEGQDSPAVQQPVDESSEYETLTIKHYRHIDRSELVFGDVIGMGEFGEVCRGVWTPSGGGKSVQVAVKRLQNTTAAAARKRFLQEAELMGRFVHNNIVRLVGVCGGTDQLEIVLELMVNGSLLGYLCSLQPMPGQQVHADTPLRLLSISNDIIRGLKYLHGQGFVHRDLAARNMLLDDNMTCKIGDFGMSLLLTESDYYTSHGGKLPVKWCAPEVLMYRRFTLSSDIWSMGIVLHEIWSLGRKPYFVWTALKGGYFTLKHAMMTLFHTSKYEVAEQVCCGYRLPPPPGCTRELYEIMIDCWSPQPNARPTAQALQQRLQKFFSNFSADHQVVSQIGKNPLATSEHFSDLQRKYIGVKH